MILNQGFEYRERLGADAEGWTLLDYLVQRRSHSTAAEWEDRIRTGRVLLDARRARPESLVRPGQVLVWRRPPWKEPDAPASFAVLLDDGELLAVAKPAGLPTLPGGGFLRATLLYHVRAYAADAAPLHRLGRWTSGLVLFARSRQARAELSRQWAAREVRKRYRCLVLGLPAPDMFDIDVPIGPVPHPMLGSVHGASAAGKPARSRVAVVERRCRSSLCDVWIASGRPHQIRIHLAAAGHPLVGDPLYAAGGRPSPYCRSLPGDQGYRLHAAELTVQHPLTARETTVACAAPRLLRRGYREA